MPPFRKQWTNSLQSEKKFFKSFYIVNTTKARQGHIIKLIENVTYSSKMQSKSVNCIKKPIFLISIENTIDKINVSTLLNTNKHDDIMTNYYILTNIIKHWQIWSHTDQLLHIDNQYHTLTNIII